MTNNRKVCYTVGSSLKVLRPLFSGAKPEGETTVKALRLFVFGLLVLAAPGCVITTDGVGVLGMPVPVAEVRLVGGSSYGRYYGRYYGPYYGGYWYGYGSRYRTYAYGPWYGGRHPRHRRR